MKRVVLTSQMRSVVCWILLASGFQVHLAATETDQLINLAARRLVGLQEDDGAWPYEGVYRVGPKSVIPVGYRVGGSSIVCSALISARLDNRAEADAAVAEGTRLILGELAHPLMKPSEANRYDVRVWGHIFALDYFCRLKASGGYDELTELTNPWIQTLVDALVVEEVPGGGWNYATKRRHGCFVTATALQALLLANEAGATVPAELFQRGAAILRKTRITKNAESGAFQYSGTAGNDTLPGSIARAPLCETTLLLLGEGDQQRLAQAIEAFHTHWDELEKRRKKTGTHMPPHGVAPYYFYFGHRYVAQAIRLLPDAEQDEAFARFVSVLLRTKDPDNTWNDRVFDRSKAYGTAMSILALSRERVLMPGRLAVRR